MQIDIGIKINNLHYEHIVSKTTLSENGIYIFPVLHRKLIR